MQKHKKILILSSIILILLCFTLYFYFNDNDDNITATGMIETTQVDITPKVSGYLMERRFEEGTEVAEGDIVAVIDKKDYELQYQQAMGAYLSSKSQLVNLEKGSRYSEIASYKAMMDAADNARNKAISDFKRFNELYNKGAISAQQLDNYKVAMTNAIGAFDQSQAQYNLAVEGTRVDEIIAQKHITEERSAALEIAKVNLERTDLKAPATGKVLSKNYEVGEYIQAGAPIATIGVLEDCWVKIYVPSTMLGNITLGQKAQVKIDSHPNTVFQGYIKEIGTQAEFTPRQTITKDERANLVFSVKVALENKEGIFKPGMPAEVKLI